MPGHDAAWRIKPSWYLIATRDRMIPALPQRREDGHDVPRGPRASAGRRGCRGRLLAAAWAAGPARRTQVAQAAEPASEVGYEARMGGSIALMPLEQHGRGVDQERQEHAVGLRAEFVLTSDGRQRHLPAETARTSTSFSIFDGTSEIRRMIIGRARYRA